MLKRVIISISIFAMTFWLPSSLHNDNVKCRDHDLVVTVNGLVEDGSTSIDCLCNCA